MSYLLIGNLLETNYDRDHVMMVIPIIKAIIYINIIIYNHIYMYVLDHHFMMVIHESKKNSRSPGVSLSTTLS